MSVIVSLQSKVCSQCKEVKTLNGFSKNKTTKNGCQSECKVCVKERNAKYYEANPEKFRAWSSKRRAANPEKEQLRYAKWCAANPHKVRAYSSKRRTAKLKAIPKWLTEEDWQSMEDIGKEADRLTQETGVKYEVDHIHPLQGKLICGLQCPSNLQILTKSENCSKGNRFKPYVESA